MGVGVGCGWGEDYGVRKEKNNLRREEGGKQTWTGGNEKDGVMGFEKKERDNKVGATESIFVGTLLPQNLE